MYGGGKLRGALPDQRSESDWFHRTGEDWIGRVSTKVRSADGGAGEGDSEELMMAVSRGGLLVAAGTRMIRL
jgi:hypothetical protein